MMIISINDIWFYILLIVLHRTTGNPIVSFNQPKFCPNASWNSDIIIFANLSIDLSESIGFFIDVNNTVYVADTKREQILLWFELRVQRRITIDIHSPKINSLFVTSEGEIYVDNSHFNGRIEKWTMKTNTSVPVMYVIGACYSLFVDINNTLYCSMKEYHQVVAKSLNNHVDQVELVAGTGCPGSISTMLFKPHEIFVDINLDLYVADSGNNRIQRFHPRKLNGITVAGRGASNTVTLSYPTGIVLDGNGYLFIVDLYNLRIVAEGPNGFRCIIGCVQSDMSSNRMIQPQSLMFDSYGHIYVMDPYTTQIQKYLLSKNSCHETILSQKSLRSTVKSRISTKHNESSKTSSKVLSYNQPKFGDNANWNSIPITFLTQHLYDIDCSDIFIDTNNTVYVADRKHKQILFWSEGSEHVRNTIATKSRLLNSLFVTSEGEIYIDNGHFQERIDKWTKNTNTSVPVMYVIGACYSLFVDINNTLYCSMKEYHQVVAKSLNNHVDQVELVAGTGCPGSISTMLFKPHEIFVDINLDLYVADSVNNRIQRFHPRELNGITVAGMGASNTVTLSHPTGVVLDGNGYLFIADSDNYRIIAEGSNGFRCIIGCSRSDITSSQRVRPESLMFDSYGHLYVTDVRSGLVKKYVLSMNSCDTSINLIEYNYFSNISASIINSNASQSRAHSYNLPNLDSTVLWITSGEVMVNKDIVGSHPVSIYINTQNSIFAINQEKGQIIIWSNENVTPTKIISTNLTKLFGLFVTTKDEIYVAADENIKGRVYKWTANDNRMIRVMSVIGTCDGLFVDTINRLYCSMSKFHRVITKFLDNSVNVTTIVAGTGCSGSEANMLYFPYGIFVDIHFNLYVADCFNNRVQLFRPGQLNGTTVAGNRSIVKYSLSCPIGVIIDRIGYLYIVDSNNHRIVAQGPDGFRCLVGCSSFLGLNSAKLKYPHTMAFDIYGNMFITDTFYNRIQKFYVSNKRLEPIYIQPNLSIHAQWDSNGTIFMDKNTVANLKATNMFIDRNNTIYVTDRSKGKIYQWLKGNATQMRIVNNTLDNPSSLFVTINGEIYVSGATSIEKWNEYTGKSVVVMNITSLCFGLFIDMANRLFCSLKDEHRVIIQSLNENRNSFSRVVVGTGKCGSASHMLCQPHGIFVDSNLDLYVADCGNNRIQHFLNEELNDKTKPKSNEQSNVKAQLDCPTAILMDSEKNLFVVHGASNRVVKITNMGFSCVIGCCDLTSSNQFNVRSAAAFDHDGNIFLLDMNNHRILKFMQITNMPNEIDASLSVESLSYSSELTRHSQQYHLHKTNNGIFFLEPYYYYQAIQVNVITAGTYSIRGKGSLKIVGSLYENDFSRKETSKNLIVKNNDDGANDHFELFVYLQTCITYILVVVPYDEDKTSLFSIHLSGPNNVCLNDINMRSIVQLKYLSTLTRNNRTYLRAGSEQTGYSYEAIRVNVSKNGCYTFISESTVDTYGYIYKNSFNPFYPLENLLIKNDNSNNNNTQFHLSIYLENSLSYILVVTTCLPNIEGNFSILVYTSNNVNLNSLSSSSVIKSVYTDELTMSSRTYSRNCRRLNYYYETIRLNAMTSGYHIISSSSNIDTYGSIYENEFNPLNPFENLIKHDDDGHRNGQFKLTLDLQVDMTYILVITTFNPNVTGLFSIDVYSANKIDINRSIQSEMSCYSDTKCRLYTRNIGITLDDILRDEIQSNVLLSNQSVMVQISSALMMIMFVIGLINSILSYLTFKDKTLRQVGCGIYLLASSITSLFTIVMFTIKFWFVLLSQMNPSMNLSIHRIGCISIEPLIKLCIYLDSWLNACVAVERAVTVGKGIHFEKKKSVRIARWLIVILPCVIVIMLIHEPLYRDLIENNEEKDELEKDLTKKHVWCITRYPPWIQTYNTVILFVHLVVPFVMNLFSALFIIFRAARQRSVSRGKQTHQQHVREQFREHKQLLFSPIILLMLSLPRVIISLLSDCINVSRYSWIYLCAYFISVIPSMLVFVVFVLPSALYRKTFKDLFKT